MDQGRAKLSRLRELLNNRPLKPLDVPKPQDVVPPDVPDEPKVERVPVPPDGVPDAPVAHVSAWELLTAWLNYRGQNMVRQEIEGDDSVGDISPLDLVKNWKTAVAIVIMVAIAVAVSVLAGSCN